MGYGAPPPPGNASTFGASAGIGATSVPGATPSFGASPALGASSAPARSLGGANLPASSTRSPYEDEDARSSRARRSVTPLDDDRSFAKQIANQYKAGTAQRSTCPAVNRILGNNNDNDNDDDLDAGDDDTNADADDLSSEES